jgi:hypothetical protein
MVKDNTQIQIGVQFFKHLKIEDNPIKCFRHLVHRPQLIRLFGSC